MRLIVSSLVATAFAQVSRDSSGDEVTMYFIRHGESVWNIFKDYDIATIKSDQTILPEKYLDGSKPPSRASKKKCGDEEDDNLEDENAVSEDAAASASGSWISRLKAAPANPEFPFQNKYPVGLRDASLSRLGHIQCMVLGRKIFQQQPSVDQNLKDVLTTENGEGIDIYTSNLLRTQQTMANFLDQRQDKTNPLTITVMNSLQEISGAGNIDARSAKSNRGRDERFVSECLLKPQFTWLLHDLKIIDCNARIGRWSSELRFERFIGSIIVRKVQKPVLVAGHSSWLQKLYKSESYGPSGDDTNRLEDRLKQIKLGNAGLIKFKLNKITGKIVAGSTQLISSFKEMFADEVCHLKKIDKHNSLGA
jgi:hypothetical protein